eukprot:544002_1
MRTVNKEKSKLLTDGYVRHMQATLNHQIIPIEINQLCLMFYYINPITTVMTELNYKLDPNHRPNIADLETMGLIPEQWLRELYGFHYMHYPRGPRMVSAVVDLRSLLNVPPILADVVVRDVLDEIEAIKEDDNISL